MSAELAAAGRWYAYAVWCALRQTWDDMPGPCWVKVALIVVCVLIPGPQDEIALILMTRVFRAWRKRQANKIAATEGTS